MNIRIPREFYRALALLTSVVCPLAASAATLPDANIAELYSFSNNFQNVGYVACGHFPDVRCVARGSIGPFGYVGGLVEGYPTINGNTVQRNLYIVDIAAGTNSSDVVLFRYQRTDTVTADSYDITYKLTASVKLPLVGGSDATCTLAANLRFVAIGTDKSVSAVVVTKGSLDLRKIDGVFDMSPVSTITANDNGFISIMFGGVDGPGFVLIGPDGTSVLASDSAGYFSSNSKTGLSTKGLLKN
jgi:hypothetical protein